MRGLSLAPVLLCLLPGAAGAEVIHGAILHQSGAGRFVKLAAEDVFAVGEDNFDTDHLYAFDETQAATLDRAVRVDIGGEMGVIPGGTVVASHYVFFDSLRGTHWGYVDFDAPILGVAAQQDTLAATDFLGHAEIAYLSTELRGLEEGDHVWIDPKRPTRLWVDWAGSSPGDYLRVFTESAPPMM